MEIITGSREDLIDMLDDALGQVGQVKKREQKMAFYNFIGNLYGSINVNSEENYPIDYKDCFRNRRNFVKFMKQADLYEKRFCSRFYDYKDFHREYKKGIFLKKNSELFDSEALNIIENMIKEEIKVKKHVKSK